MTKFDGDFIIHFLHACVFMSLLSPYFLLFAFLSRFVLEITKWQNSTFIFCTFYMCMCENSISCSCWYFKCECGCVWVLWLYCIVVLLKSVFCSTSCTKKCVLYFLKNERLYYLEYWFVLVRIGKYYILWIVNRIWLWYVFVLYLWHVYFLL